jgi:2-dehydro-3-deoxyphosphogluconate aldolase/(4S)-4-hydroxy-2-oxoglutarate aldolase
MGKEETLKKIRELGLLAVIRGPAPDLTVKMIEALVDGGVYGIEVTYSTPNAAEVVETIHQKMGERLLLGMGTLTDPEQAAEAKAAGASFLVSPHYEAELAEAMCTSGLAVMIGAFTPSEVFRAYKSGSDVVKIFPGSLGGPAYLKALRGPFPHIPLMPTGGVDADNLGAWFAAGAYAVAAGSQLCPVELAKAGQFDEIRARARSFAQAVEQARKSI